MSFFLFFFVKDLFMSLNSIKQVLIFFYIKKKNKFKVLV